MSNPAYNYASYRDLQNILDELLGKIGLDKTIQLMREIMNRDNKGTGSNRVEKHKLITSYIISSCVTIFNLDDSEFNSSQVREYRDARMACYHLLKKYTDCSYERIAQLLSQKKRNVLYYCQKCEEVLSVPQFHRNFADKYNSLEEFTVEFIAKINGSNIYEDTKSK